ncbi:tetratricopeptide repeat protein [Portibacter lacus]|uniref:Tetratricopeptide repeat protein n=1 Tax=Portibacter lacus TaxID=1099794 RepID=A0AA37WFA2_9BACT|nr:hypothetical protein [Portibacter lacus]GLR18312.1 hypothetical protein GCM10007940_29280 [Portibacter lacus]
MRKIALYLSIPFLLTFCTSQEEQIDQNTTELGVLEYEFKISDVAKEDFDKGLLLIHSFEYDDANAAFQAGKLKDSTEIMNYWGEAMSHYKALWGLQDKRAGYEVMEQLGETKEDRLARISDPLEKDFWQGVEILYGDGSLKERNASFNAHMKTLSEKYPKNQEAAAFYALSLMWDNDRDDDKMEVGKESARIAAGILAENPMHPGALHYTIHAYDNPVLADGAMNAAYKYSKVAPDAAHALHMPSHIFLAMGMWQEVVNSNEVSYAASVKRMEKLGLDDDARGYHSYAWLHYAYLQQGRVADATKLLEDIATYYGNTQSKGIRSYIISMQAAQLFETGEWPDGLEVLEVEKSDLGLGSQMRSALFKAQMAFNDLVEMKAVRAELNKEIEKGELYISEDKAAMCSAGPSRYAPNEDAVIKAKVVLSQIDAMIAVAADDGRVEEHMKNAVQLEGSSEYSFGPVDISLPSFEMYGYWLAENGEHEKAIAQFKKSLERAPNRRNALLGLKKVYVQTGDQEEVKSIDDQLAEFHEIKSLTSI